MMHPVQYSAELISKREVIAGIFHMVLHAPSIARQAKPGQFVMVQVQQGSDPLLRRPISLCGAADDRIELLFQVRGRGTGLMAEWEPGHKANILGPLGTGFVIPPDMKTAVLVAGGIGAAPLLYLAKALLGFSDIKREFYFGSKTSKERPLIEEFLSNRGFEYFFATEDGSSAIKGFVTAALLSDLKRKSIMADQTYVFSCGPEPMLKKVSEISDNYKLKCQVSLEARMACGVGACLGCVAATIHGFKRVCADGPVFNSEDIIWSHD